METQDEADTPTTTPTIPEEISLADMDAAVRHVTDLRAAYKAAKKLSDAAYEQQKQAEAHLILMLEKSNRSVYILEGVARVKVSHEMSVQTPKTAEDKLAFFKWLAEKKGQDVADNYLTINANSLNSLYNELTEEAAMRGEVLMIDGLGEPVTRVSLSITKA